MKKNRYLVFRKKDELQFNIGEITVIREQIIYTTGGAIDVREYDCYLATTEQIAKNFKSSISKVLREKKRENYLAEERHSKIYNEIVNYYKKITVHQTGDTLANNKS